MDANLVVVVLKCAAAIFAIGLGAWGAVIVGRYAKWAMQLSRLAARANEHNLPASAIASPVRPMPIFVHDYLAREQFEEPVLQLESAL